MKRVWIGIVVLGLAGCGGGTDGDGPFPASVAQLVAYTARPTPGQPKSLYVTDVEAGGARRVSGPPSTGLDILVFAWSADHRFLAYTSDLDGDGAMELYVVTPGVDEDPGRLVSSGHVSTFVWSATGADLAFTSKEEVPTENAGYVLRDGAAAALRITPPPQVAGGGVNEVVLAPDGSRVAFTGKIESSERWDLYTVRLDGTGWVKVCGPLVDGASAYGPRWSPTSERIAWTSDPTLSGHRGAYSSLAAGGDLRLVSGAAIVGGDVSDFAWSGDGERIAFRGDLLQDGVFELFAADARGLARIRISGPMPVIALIVVGDVYAFAWSPDGTRLAYTADQDVDEVVDLYVTDSLTPSSWTMVSGAHPPTGKVMEWTWSPASDRLLMRADFDVDDHARVYTVPADGGPRVDVSGALGANGHVYQAHWSLDGSHVLFGADLAGTNTFDLFSAPAAGGPRTNLSNLEFPGFVTYEVHPALDGRVAFVSNLDVWHTDELFSVERDGSDLVKVSGPLPAGGAVLEVKTR